MRRAGAGIRSDTPADFRGIAADAIVPVMIEMNRYITMRGYDCATRVQA